MRPAGVGATRVAAWPLEERRAQLASAGSPGDPLHVPGPSQSGKRVSLRSAGTAGQDPARVGIHSPALFCGPPAGGNDGLPVRPPTDT